MSRTVLSSSSDWELANGAQDIRGFAALDAAGAQVGIVRALIADTASEIVSTIVLDTGAEVPAFDVTIGDGVVYLAGAIPGASTPGEMPEPMTHQEARRVGSAPPLDPAHQQAFRAHHAAVASAHEYEVLEAAYRYGYTAAHAPAYRNRAYPDVEAALRASYPTVQDFERDRDAIRFGFLRAQQGAQ